MRIVVMAMVLVGACAPMAAPSEAPAGVAGCGATSAAVLVGRMFDETLLADAKRLSGTQIVRVIRPGDMTTKDFRENRLNLNLDENGAVASANCG